MEGKLVTMSVVLVSFLVVLGQIQVEAQQLRSCCPSTTARNVYNACRIGGGYPSRCASLSGCRHLSTCPPGWQHDIIGNTGDNEVTQYCKLGCVSSMCSAITTLQSSDASEVVNGAVEKCTNACSDYCTKGSITAVETAA